LQMGFFDRLINICYRALYGYKLETWAAGQTKIPVTLGTFMPFFYQDKSYTYFAQPEISDNADFEFGYQDLEDFLLAILEGNTIKTHEILARFPRGAPLSLLTHFYNFYHPLVCSFIRILFDKGIDALMSRDTQLIGDAFFDRRPGKFDFNQVHQPTGLVYSGQPVTYALPSGPVTDQHPGYPKGDVDFNIKGSYSSYNWELFFHAPLMIAERLSRNQKFEDADHWFRYIFNPTDASQYPSPDKYWEMKQFFINVNDKYTQQNIQNIMLGINSNIQSLVDDVTDWRNNPFQPHYIAQYRTLAYQKTTIMKYLDHLIAWGDSLYRQDTMESVAEATQLYVLAAQILGPQPKIIPPAYELPIDNYGQLQQKLDAFSNALVDIENVLPIQEIVGSDGTTNSEGLPNLETFYFCVPLNDKLMGYWATVGKRLYNIRHCLNIEGKFAPLALFAPPIDPGLLVRATAAGLDIGSILTDMNAPLPNYRFDIVVQKATELCNEVKSLGAALLQAMEKNDAENFALLRSSNGISVLKAALELRKQQVEEADHNLEALQQQQNLVQARIDHFQGLINAGLNRWETASLNLTQSAIGGEQTAIQNELLVNVLALIPDLEIGGSGFGGTPTVTGQFGGAQLAGAMRALAGAMRGTASVMHSQANVSSTQATNERRKEDWQYQVTLAKDELQQVHKQILAATVRQAIANKEVENQQLQIDNSQAEDDFMHSKFTNADLYSWMIGQISNIYFQSFQLAYGLAKQAEQTFRYELGLGDSSFIQFGYWDSLKKGLLAADQLSFDVRRMEKAYHDQNAREYELTKHISLAQLDPSALLLLKTKGECWINVPEEVYDMDYPGQYMRRINNAAFTIPVVAGPYTTVSCTVTMTKNSMRVSSDGGDPNKYSRKKLANGAPADDPRFRDSVGTIQSIAISGALNDSGLFELNFRDERYLPFEGAGAISQWHLRLPAPYPQFDYSTISDVIMHVKYKARDGGEQLRNDATTSLKDKINSMLVSLKDTGLMRAFSARHEFPTEWYAFLNPSSETTDQILTLDIGQDRFPYFASVVKITITGVELVADADTSLVLIDKIQVAPTGTQVTPTPLNTSPLSFSASDYGAMLHLGLSYASQKPGTWTITNVAGNTRLTSDNLKDLIIIVHYEVT
jgi:Tc toxin complex TcA C-terminal TcB-binding domain